MREKKHFHSLPFRISTNVRCLVRFFPESFELRSVLFFTNEILQLLNIPFRLLSKMFFTVRRGKVLLYITKSVFLRIAFPPKNDKLAQCKILLLERPAENCFALSRYLNENYTSKPLNWLHRRPLRSTPRHATDRFFMNCSSSFPVVLSQASSRRSFEYINTEPTLGHSIVKLALGKASD